MKFGRSLASAGEGSRERVRLSVGGCVCVPRGVRVVIVNRKELAYAAAEAAACCVALKSILAVE